MSHIVKIMKSQNCSQCYSSSERYTEKYDKQDIILYTLSESLGTRQIVLKP